MIEIKTSALKTRKHALIDGVAYTVRRMGNIEQLDLSQSMRRLNRLSEKEKAGTKLTDAELAEVDTVSAKLTGLFVSLFDDGGDQSKSRALLASLTDEEIGLVLSDIFKDETPQKALDEPKTN